MKRNVLFKLLSSVLAGVCVILYGLAPVAAVDPDEFINRNESENNNTYSSADVTTKIWLKTFFEFCEAGHNVGNALLLVEAHAEQKKGDWSRMVLPYTGNSRLFATYIGKQ